MARFAALVLVGVLVAVCCAGKASATTTRPESHGAERQGATAHGSAAVRAAGPSLVLAPGGAAATEGRGSANGIVVFEPELRVSPGHALTIAAPSQGKDGAKEGGMVAADLNVGAAVDAAANAQVRRVVGADPRDKGCELCVPHAAPPHRPACMHAAVTSTASCIDQS